MAAYREGLLYQAHLVVLEEAAVAAHIRSPEDLAEAVVVAARIQHLEGLVEAAAGVGGKPC